MRVLHVNNVANIASIITKELTRRGHEAEVFKFLTGGAHISLIGRIFRIGQRLIQLFELLMRMRREGHDIIHIHYGYYGLIGWISGKPYVLHCHGTDVRSNLYRHPFKYPTVLALKKASKVYYSTPDLAEHIFPYREDAEFLPNPIDTGLFQASNLSEDVKADSAPSKVFILSRIEPIKGTTTAIEAVKTASESVPLTITAIDWGSNAGRYRSDKKLELKPLTSYDEMPTLLSKYDICVGQLKLGIISMAELEAMSLAKPVVMYFKYREVYDESPPIINVNPTIADVRDALIHLHEHPDHGRSLGRESREWVLKYHDVKVVCQRLLADYSQLSS